MNISIILRCFSASRDHFPLLCSDERVPVTPLLCSDERVPVTPLLCSDERVPVTPLLCSDERVPVTPLLCSDERVPSRDVGGDQAGRSQGFRVGNTVTSDLRPSDCQRSSEGEARSKKMETEKKLPVTHPPPPPPLGDTMQATAVLPPV
ncbi:hypothetical protein NQZ68_011137 [Dissostichus eleginoides]|nr:hypothetical protein NQZ68_011137 [Dissostichus eleginoides]